MVIKLFRFQNNHQKPHREQQVDRIERDVQRNRPQNTGGVSSSNGGATVNSVNNRVAGFSRQRDSRDDDYARSEQQIEA